MTSEERRWWEVYVTGAVRTGERLNSAEIKDKKGDIIPKECQLCGANEKEDMEHILWQCQNPEIKKAREEFLKIIGKFAMDVPEQNRARVTRDPSIWEPMLRTHGLMPSYDEETIQEQEVEIIERLEFWKPIP